MTTTTKTTRRSSKAATATATSDSAQLLFDTLSAFDDHADPDLSAQFPYVTIKVAGGYFHLLDRELSRVIQAPPGELIKTLSDALPILSAYDKTRVSTGAIAEVPTVPEVPEATTSRRSRRSNTATDANVTGTLTVIPSGPITTVFNPELQITQPTPDLPDSTVSAIVTMSQAIDARLDTMAEAIAALRTSADRQFSELAELILTVQEKQEKTDQHFAQLREFLAVQQGQTIAKIEALIPSVPIPAKIPTAPIAAPIATAPDLSIPSGPFIRKNTNTGKTTLVIPVTDPACDMDHYLGIIDEIADQTGLALPEDHPTRLDHPTMGALMVLPIVDEFYVAMEAGGFPAQAA
jgi:hypothetical protein